MLPSRFSFSALLPWVGFISGETVPCCGKGAIALPTLTSSWVHNWYGKGSLKGTDGPVSAAHPEPISGLGPLIFQMARHESDVLPLGKEVWSMSLPCLTILGCEEGEWDIGHCAKGCAVMCQGACEGDGRWAAPAFPHTLRLLTAHLRVPGKTRAQVPCRPHCL